jgi:cobalt-zinc-cadmium efflux system outer membrane protein
MRRHVVRWSLILGLIWWGSDRQATAQGPTIEGGTSALPGTENSMLGSAPGSGGVSLGENPGAGGQILGGRPGASTPRVPTSAVNPSQAASPTALQMDIRAPKPKPTPTAPFYGSLSLPEIVEDEGPAGGLTLDSAIDRTLRENLDLRAKFFEIPQAQADILQAGLRANPIFYADTQLVPYGQYNRASTGGPTQYDVNISYPLDVSRKRQARVVVASRAKRVLEALYQDAVRMRIDEVYQSFVDVLAARQTIRYAKKSVEGLDQLLDVEQKKFQQDVTTRAEVKRVEIQRDSARIGLIDAEEQYRKTKRTLATLLNLPPTEVDSLEVRGTIFDRFSPPPPQEELNRIALTVRPDVVSYRLGIHRAEADVKLALANRFADVYVLYQPYTFQNNTPFGLKSPTSWALGVTVPLPVYNRNQGGIQRAKLNVTQTQIQLATLERQALTEVAQAYLEYRTSLEMVRHIEKDVLPDAELVLNDSRRLYLGGEKDVTYYLMAQRDYNDLVKQYLDTMVRHRRSMLALNTALGQRILP